MSFWKVLPVALLLCWFCAVLPAQAAPGWLDAKGQYIVDATGKPFTLCGTAFFVGGKGWKEYPRSPEEYVRYYTALGLNAFRLSFFITPRVLGERSFAEYVTAELEPFIDACRKANAYVILDMHEYRHSPFGGDSGDPYPDFKQTWLASWRSLAERYRDEPTIAAYELWNEPDIAPGGRQTPEETRAWLQEAIQTVRTVDRRHLLIVNGVQGGFGPQTAITWGSRPHYDPSGPKITFADTEKWQNPDPEKRLVFAFHMGFFENNQKMGADILPYHIENHRRILRAFSAAHHVPVFCSEWEDEPPHTATRAFLVAAAEWLRREPLHIGWLLWRCHTSEALAWHHSQGWQARGELDPPFADVWLPLARATAGNSNR